MNKFMKKFNIIITIIVIISVFTNCKLKHFVSNENQKILAFAENGVPSTLDPTQSGTKYANTIVTAIYDTLYEYKYLKTPYTIKPNLAEGIPIISGKGLIYTINIKKGIFFTDDPAFKDGKGREVTANDFVYSIKRHFDPKNKSQGAWLWKGKIEGLDNWAQNGSDYNIEIDGLKALDRYTIYIKLTNPFPQFIYTLAMGYSSVIPREAVDKYGDQISKHPVGSGPFKLESFDNEKAVLVKNDKYRNEILDIKKEGYIEKIHEKYNLEEIDGKKLPLVDKVIIYFLADQKVNWNSFSKENKVQNTIVPNELIEKILKSPVKPYKLRPQYLNKYHIMDELEFGFVYSGFNMENPKFGFHPNPVQNKKNKALRMAIRKSFNWPERIKNFYYNLGEAYPGVIHPALEDYEELSNESITYDPEGAKILLKKYGWNQNNLPILEYGSIDGERDKKLFEQFKKWLQDIGYPENKIKNKIFSNFGEYNKVLKRKKLTFFSLSWGMDYPDSENLLQLFYGPNSSPGSNNFNYKNAEYDNLYKKALKMFPGKERTKLYQKLNKIIVDDSVAICAFSRTYLHLWKKETIMYPRENFISNIFKYVDVKN